MRLPALALLSLLALSSACDSATAQTTSASTRSSVAGTWAATYATSQERVLHLAGTDLSVRGAWTNFNDSSGAYGEVEGEFYGGVLRLNLFQQQSGTVSASLWDVVVAEDGNSATGVAYVYNGTTYPVTMTRMAAPTP